MSGLLITFEGGEGTGKSTQMRLLAARLAKAGLSITSVREPGGTPVGEAIRSILLDPAYSDMDPHAEMLLYSAARAQIVAQVIRPALDAGGVVLCDRFYDSSTAYQGHARGLPLEWIAALNTASTDGLVPDRTLVFDLSAEQGLGRATSRGADRLEGESGAFHRRVRDGFLAIAAAAPERVRVVDASGSIEDVANRVTDALGDLPSLAHALGDGS